MKYNLNNLGLDTEVVSILEGFQIVQENDVFDMYNIDKEDLTDEATAKRIMKQVQKDRNVKAAWLIANYCFIMLVPFLGWIVGIFILIAQCKDAEEYGDKISKLKGKMEAKVTELEHKAMKEKNPKKQQEYYKKIATLKEAINKCG